MSPELAFSHIVKSISDYMEQYGLLGDIVFIYRNDIRDVDILYPSFDRRIYEDAEDINTIVSLLEKHFLEVPTDLRRRQHALQVLIDQRTTIRQFEIWLMGFFAYLNIGVLETEYVYYSPENGFSVKFYGINSYFNSTRIP